MLSNESRQEVNKIRLVSRLVETTFSVEWALENVERYQSRVIGLTLKSPVFQSTFGGCRWQLVMNPRDFCSSSLSLQLHKSSPTKRSSVDYHFGISNVDSQRELEDRGQMTFDLDEAVVHHPTILFNWKQLMEMKSKVFVNNCLMINCQIVVLDYLVDASQ